MQTRVMTSIKQETSNLNSWTIIGSCLYIVAFKMLEAAEHFDSWGGEILVHPTKRFPKIFFPTSLTTVKLFFLLKLLRLFVVCLMKMLR